MDDSQTGHEEEIAAALLNTVMLRLGQTGRNFATAEDYRALRLCTQIVMQLQPVPVTEHMGRPQNLPLHPRVGFLTRVEDQIKAQIRRMPAADYTPLSAEEMAAKLSPESAST